MSRRLVHFETDKVPVVRDARTSNVHLLKSVEHEHTACGWEHASGPVDLGPRESVTCPRCIPLARHGFHSAYPIDVPASLTTNDLRMEALAAEYSGLPIAAALLRQLAGLREAEAAGLVDFHLIERFPSDPAVRAA